MPLQFSSTRRGRPKRRAFSPLKRGNASTIEARDSFAGSATSFQSPQAGQCLYNIICLAALRAVGVDFQSPQAGQCLYNTQEDDGLSKDWYLSVPSSGAMP